MSNPSHRRRVFDLGKCIIFIVGMDRAKYHRKSIRLDGYDYSSTGAYFVTLVAYHRQCLFGEILNGRMVLSSIGGIVQDEWFISASIRKEIRLDPEDFVVMPNHVHGIAQIVEINGVGAHGMRPVMNSGGRRPPLQRPPRSLSSFIAGFKSSVTKRALAIDETLTGSIWQRNFYEHIIRNEREWARIRTYIETNPANWSDDDENPFRL